MKSERVTRTWEFYRDNCDGFKEPMRKELRNLDGYVSSIEAENAKLMERYYAYEYKMDGLVCKLTGGLLSKSATLPNDALYSVVEEQMTDELVEENFKLGLENAELRELCRDLFDRLMDKDEHCGECRSQCEHDAWNFGDPKCVYAKRMRELGVEAEHD